MTDVPRRRDYYDDPAAPAATSLRPAASAIVPGPNGEILLHRRADNGLWALPGGLMELGESLADTVRREVREETGLDVEPGYVIGVYSDPLHVFAYPDGEVRQEFSVCVACTVTGGSLAISPESTDLRFFVPGEIGALPIHPRILTRITDYLTGQRAALC
ncbi:NUDIX domain-containing protein [Longispora albida]|uniref:NUDIX domain-containing protein n=1 Tax=Longispora albida TaxID=203523 RepID=UPI000374F6E1|nr:NUDIX domain-containing protein [Longispora albida]